MASIQKPIRLVNPGTVKKRLSLKQKLHFGTARQRAAARVSLGNGGKKSTSTNRKYRKAVKSGNYAKAMHYNKQQTTRKKLRKYKSKDRAAVQKSNNSYWSPSSRLPNVGEIITIKPLTNSGSKSNRKKGILSNMASKKRRLAGLKAARTRKRNKSAKSHATRSSHRRRSTRRNSGVMRTRTRTVVKYRTRNAGVRKHHRRYRRNSGIMSGGGSEFTKVAGAIGGAMVTSAIMSFVPPQFSTGIIGYVATAIVATLQGTAAGKILKNPALGTAMRTGGFVYLALKIAKDYFPGLNLGLSLNGMRGMGLIGGSSFYTPQVPNAGNMGTFQLPSAVSQMQMMATGMKGLGTTRRVGRMR